MKKIQFLEKVNKLKKVNNSKGSFEIPQNKTQKELYQDNSFTIRIKQIRSSTLFGIYYIVVIMMCLCLLVWTVIKKFHPRNFLFVVFEGVLTILLILDVLMDVIISGCQFFSSWMSIVDLIICCLSVLSFLLYMISPHLSYGEEFENLADLALITFWSLTQIARLILFIIQFFFF
jgi:hypothetical protein